MRSVAAAPPARERIVRSAMQLFAEHGFHGASVRRIAASADVSPGLVIHHFGSKEGLRKACDERVVDMIRARWVELGFSHPDRGGENPGDAADGGEPAVDGGSRSGLPQLTALLDEELSATRYLAQAITDGGPSTDALVDDLVSLTEQAQKDLVRAGALAPTEDPAMRALLLVLWDLAPIVLADHVRRITGSDPLTRDGLARLARVGMEIYTSPLFTSTDWLPDLAAESSREASND